MGNKFEQLEALVQGTKADAEKFYGKKISAAGTRLRKKMQEIKVLAQEIRLEVTDIKNS